MRVIKPEKSAKLFHVFYFQRRAVNDVTDNIRKVGLFNVMASLLIVVGVVVVSVDNETELAPLDHALRTQFNFTLIDCATFYLTLWNPDRNRFPGRQAGN